MKTRNLISMGMLTALLAACSNELEMPGATVGNDAARPSAGKVVIVPNVVGNETDATTRAEWTGRGWKFEAGDDFGAMLMDTWNGTNEGNTTVNDYTFTDYVHTNYKYTADGEGLVWACKDDDNALAGNYFFYYPYDEKLRERGYVRPELNNHQLNYDKKTGDIDWSYAVRDNQRYLGYAFIPSSNEDINEIPVDFYPLFATPKFKLHNLSGNDIRLMKLIIRTHQHGPADTPMLMPSKVAIAPLSGGFESVAEDYPEMTQKEQIASLFSHSTRVLDGWFAQPINSASAGLESDNEEGVYEYTIEFGPDYTLGTDEIFKACAVMPAGEYYNFDVFAFVQLAKSGKTGVISLRNLKKADWSDFDSQNGSMQTVLKPGIQQVLTASFDAQSIENLALNDFAVNTTADLEEILKFKAEDGGKDLVVIKTLGDEVEMSQTVYDWLADEAHAGIRVQIDGTIVIPEGLPEDAIDKWATPFTNGLPVIETTFINKGTQVVELPLKADIINEGTATVIYMEGDVTNSGKFTGVKVVGTVTNGATDDHGAELVITSDDTTTGQVTTVFNYGTAETEGLLWNFTNYAGGNWFVRGDQTVNNSVNNHAGATIQVDNDVVLTDAKASFDAINNEGTIQNFGTINRVYENKGVIYNGNEADTDATLRIASNYVTKDAGVKVNGFIYNYGHITDMSFNDGIIYMQAGTAKVEFKKTDNGKGDIENTLHGDILNIGEQNVIYTAAGKDIEDVLDEMLTYGKYTELVIATNYTLEDGVAISRTTAGNEMEKITIAANAIVDIDYDADVQMGGEYISLYNYGLLTINHGAELLTGDIYNYGTVKKNNNATLTFAGSCAYQVAGTQESFD